MLAVHTAKLAHGQGILAINETGDPHRGLPRMTRDARCYRLNLICPDRLMLQCPVPSYGAILKAVEPLAGRA